MDHRSPLAGTRPPIVSQYPAEVPSPPYEETTPSTKCITLTHICIALVDCLWQVFVVLYDWWLFEPVYPSIVYSVDHGLMILGVLTRDYFGFTIMRLHVLCDRATWYFVHALFGGLYSVNVGSLGSLSMLMFEITRFISADVHRDKKITFGNIMLFIMVYDAAMYAILSCVHAKFGFLVHSLDAFVYEYYVPSLVTQAAITFIASIVAGTIYRDVSSSVLPR